MLVHIPRLTPQHWGTPRTPTVVNVDGPARRLTADPPFFNRHFDRCLTIIQLLFDHSRCTAELRRMELRHSAACCAALAGAIWPQGEWGRVTEVDEAFAL